MIARMKTRLYAMRPASTFVPTTCVLLRARIVSRGAFAGALACVCVLGLAAVRARRRRIPHRRRPRIPLRRSSRPICSAALARHSRHRSRRAMRCSAATRGCSASSPNTGERGYALFRLPSGAEARRAGREIASGATLVSVQPDAVTIRDGAGERRFVLRSHDSAGAASQRAAGARRPRVPQRRLRVPVPPPRARRLPDSVARSCDSIPNCWAGSARTPCNGVRCSRPTPGGLVVREDNGFGAMLGLKAGDRIAQANGIALSVPEDVTRGDRAPARRQSGRSADRVARWHDAGVWLANVACAG